MRDGIALLALYLAQQLIDCKYPILSTGNSANWKP